MEKQSTIQEQNKSNLRSKLSDAEDLLTDEERMVLRCKVRRLTEQEALLYCKKYGHSMKKSKFYKVKKIIKEKVRQRAYSLADGNLVERHMSMVDELDTINYEMWQCYHQEKEPLKRAKILYMIGEFIPLRVTMIVDTSIVLWKQTDLQETKHRIEQETLQNKSFR